MRTHATSATMSERSGTTGADTTSAVSWSQWCGHLYAARPALTFQDREREYAVFQRNRMRDNDERFAVKCAQRCFKRYG